VVNRRDRAINLGMKINSLKGNLSVAKSVIKDLENEINHAVIDDSDKEQLFSLYKQVIEGLKSVTSPSLDERNRVNQLIEDLIIKLKNANSYIEADGVDGSIIGIEESLKSNKILNKEHKAALEAKLIRLREAHKAKVGQFLKRNYESLRRTISSECQCESPYHVSVLIKKFNDTVKTTPLFFDDRHSLQALLDTHWQRSSAEIKNEKKKNCGFDDPDWEER
jgi:hypothetical protein